LVRRFSILILRIPVKFEFISQAIFSDENVDEGLNVYDIGPVAGWWITGLHSGESVKIGISTEIAHYFLR